MGLIDYMGPIVLSSVHIQILLSSWDNGREFIDEDISRLCPKIKIPSRRKMILENDDFSLKVR